MLIYLSLISPTRSKVFFNSKPRRAVCRQVRKSVSAEAAHADYKSKREYRGGRQQKQLFKFVLPSQPFHDSHLPFPLYFVKCKYNLEQIPVHRKSQRTALKLGQAVCD